MRTLHRLSIFLFLFCCVISAQAQKRNLVKLADISLDFMMGPASDHDRFRNLVGYSAGYERLLGSRVSVGFNFTKYFGAGEKQTTWEPVKGTPSGYKFENGLFKETGFAIGYESRYYFGDFDEEGVNSGYLGFSYQCAIFTQSLKEAWFTQQWAPTVQKDFEDQRYTINKLGVKFGYAGANAMLSDFHIGINYNLPVGLNAQWESDTRVNPLSISFGWTIGLPLR